MCGLIQRNGSRSCFYGRKEARDAAMDPNRRFAELCMSLMQVRERTMRLMAAVPDDLLNTRVHDFYSPVGWHFGHIAATEEFWVMQQAMRRQPRDPALSFLFANIPENPKENRVALPP